MNNLILTSLEQEIIAKYLKLIRLDYELESNNIWLNDKLTELHNYRIRPNNMLDDLVNRHIIRWCCDTHRWIFNY